VLDSPFEHCHVVTTTTHKSLRGPRAGLIFFRKEFEERVNFAVFPSIQGGPHNNVISAIAVQLKEVATPEFKTYAKQIVANCKTLAKALMDRGYVLATGGTDNHLILWDLRPQKLTGNKFEFLCDEVSITLNKNSIHGDTSALTPGGVRVGTPALTSRGFKEADFEQVAAFLHRAVELATSIQSALAAAAPPAAGGKAPVVTLVAFKDAVHASAEVKALRNEVETFSKKFFMPGFDVSKLKYQS
jgi:glycine hydroxymethyltransferase